MRRAFTHIYDCPIGELCPATLLRADVCPLIFTNDLRRYLRARYCALVYQKLGGYEQAARVLGIDRRTVKSRVDNAKSSRDQ